VFSALRKIGFVRKGWFVPTLQSFYGREVRNREHDFRAEAWEARLYWVWRFQLYFFGL